MNLRLISLCLIVFVGACGAKQAAKPDEAIVVPPIAEEQKIPDVAPPMDAKDEKKKADKIEAGKKQEEQFVMLNFENADIETVVSTISDMLKINYILAPGVTGKITIQSHNKIPVSELFSTFQTVLEFNGFSAVKEGSFYRIVPIDTAKQQGVPIQMGKKSTPSKDASFVTQQIPLEYVKANDIANLVRNLMPKGTDIIVYEPSNMLIISALPSGILKLLKILEAIDIPSTERDSVKTFIYHVENGEAKKLAEVLKNLYGKKSGTGTQTPVRPVQPTPAPSAIPRPRAPGTPATPSAGATIQADLLSAELEGDVLIEAYDDINALLIKSSQRAYLTLLETLKRIDIQPKQVLIEVLVAEISLSDETNLGIEWLLKTSIHAEGKDFDLFAGYAGEKNRFQYDASKPGFVFPLIDNILQHPAGGFANILDPKRFNILITAAATAGNVNVLASPNILALDNKEAKIEVGQEVPVATSVTQAGTDAVNINNTTSQVQFKSVGTILTVTPHINDKKQVTLKVNQEVSERGTPVLIGGQAYEGFITRKANTTAIVQDGHTLVIGGIIQERVTKGSSGLPFLSKIPILGYLFGTTQDKLEKRELIILITPHVVADKDEADALTAEFSNRMKDVKKKIDEQQRKFRQSRIIPDNPASILDQ
jgi:type II secretory pathway component GspD/PulD (secretin)